MSGVYGNVKYIPCKAVGQLKSATRYILSNQKQQLEAGITKTLPHLYGALGCNRDNFANNILITRKMHGKRYSKLKPNNILAHKMSISFHPDDNGKLNYEMAYDIGKAFATEFFSRKGFEVLFAVHTDTEHIHIHFLINNCNMNTGKSFRRNQKDLVEMSEFFGHQCLFHGLDHSIRDNYYASEKTQDKLTYAETQMRKMRKESFKDELREVIKLEIESQSNDTFEDVIRSLKENYNVETRIKGNTVSYRHPEYKDKNGNLIAVRASKLGDLYTRKGILYELNKSKNRSNSHTRTESASGQAFHTGEAESGKRDTIENEHRLRTPTPNNQCPGFKSTSQGNSRISTDRCPIGIDEGAVSRTTPTNQQLSDTLSEIREYSQRFHPQKSSGPSINDKTIGRKNQRTGEFKSNASKRNRQENHSPSR